MSRPISAYARPRDLQQEIGQRIQDMFPYNVRIDWWKEELNVISAEGRTTAIPMEILGKMFGIMQQHCITVRKSKRQSKL